MEALTEKEQASLDVSAQTSAQAVREQSASEMAAIREKIRAGDPGALTTRMKDVPWAKRPEEEG